jgi:hypothetical protein
LLNYTLNQDGFFRAFPPMGGPFCMKLTRLTVEIRLIRMLTPAMKKHFITILLLLLCLAIARPADARLTLGVVVGPGDGSSMLQREKVVSLANLLHEKMQEEMVVKEMPDSATIMTWLDQYAAVDLALLSSADVDTYRSRLLFVGALDAEGKVNLVARKGISPTLAQKAAEIVKTFGFDPWRPTGGEDSPEPGSIEDGPVAKDAPLTIDAVIEAQAEPAVTETKAATPTQMVIADAEQKRPAQATVKLALALIPELKGTMQTSAQAREMADYLESALPVEVKVKQFERLDKFTEWFMRYQMVDLAVVPKQVADSNLGRDYIALAELQPTKSGTKTPELFIGRRGQKTALQEQVRTVLLQAQQTAAGKDLLAKLEVSAVRTSAETLAVSPVPPPATEAPAVVKQPVPDVVEETALADVKAEKEQPLAEFPEPVEPVAPDEVVIIASPDLPKVAQKAAVPELAVPDPVPVVPEASKIPAAPVDPDSIEQAFLPVTPDAVVAPVPDAVKETALADVEAEKAQPLAEFPEPVEPVAPDEVVIIASPDLPKVAQKAAAPELAVPDLVPVVPEASEIPDAPVDPDSIEQPSLPVTPDAVVAPVPAPEALSISVDPPLASVPEAPLVPDSPVVPAKEESVDEAVVVPPAPTPEEIQVPADVPEEVVPVQKTPVVVLPQEEIPAPQTLEPEVAREMDELVAAATDDKIVEEVLEFAEPVSPDDAEKRTSVVAKDKDFTDDEIIALLGADSVAALVSQPDIPQELRPPGIPVVRPGRVSQQQPKIDEGLFLTSLPDPIPQKIPEPLPQLLPEPEPEPGVVYIVPFVSVMVPKEVNERIFDHFVDSLITAGDKLELQFVILKEGLQRVDPQWLSVRKYVTGEIYAYVEEVGSTIIDLKAKARLNYHRPRQVAPAFSFMYPVAKFLDRDAAVIEEERLKMADNIAEALAREFIKAINN